MKKLNQIQKEKVENARAAIIKLQLEQDSIYSNLVAEINIDDDWVYDYVFNCADQNDDYTTRVRTEIFE